MNTKNPINITPSPNQRKIQRANRYHNPLAKGMTSTIGGAVANFGFDTLGAIVGGEINDYYNRKAEQRADARYRDLLRDTPRLTVEARRAAGLNPYGDAVLPGQVSQSTPDTSPVSSGAFSRSRGDTLEEQLALAKIENETLVSQATADKLEAEADRLRGQEGRDVIKFPTEVRQLEENVKNAIQERNNMVAKENVDKKQLDVMERSIARSMAEEMLLKAQTITEGFKSEQIRALTDLTKAQEYEIYEGLKLALRKFEHQKYVDDIEILQEYTRIELENSGLLLQDEALDIEQLRIGIDAELRDEGLDVDWTSLGTSALWFVAFLASKNPNMLKNIFKKKRPIGF